MLRSELPAAKPVCAHAFDALLANVQAAAAAEWARTRASSSRGLNGLVRVIIRAELERHDAVGPSLSLLSMTIGIADLVAQPPREIEAALGSQLESENHEIDHLLFEEALRRPPNRRACSILQQRSIRPAGLRRALSRRPLR